MDSNRKEIIVVEPGKVKVVESPLLTQPLGKEEFVVALDSACYDPADNVILHGLYPGQKPFPFRLGLDLRSLAIWTMSYAVTGLMTKFSAADLRSASLSSTKSSERGATNRLA